MPSLDEALEAASAIEGWMEEDELRWLGEQAASHRVIVEVGSYCGRSTKMLAMMTPGVVYSVDNLAFTSGGYNDDQDAAFHENLEAELEAGKVKTIRKDSVEAAKGFRRKADMVFIDGAHEYADVLADLNAWTPKLKRGGLLCGHDMYQAGVEAAVREVLGDAWEVAAGSAWCNTGVNQDSGGIWAAK